MTKYEKISVLARETAKRISANRRNGSDTLMLRQGCTSIRLRIRFSYTHRDQTQQPVPRLKCGMRRCFCWVNRGAKGIALLDGESERPRLRYVFDVTDVHKAKRIGRDPFIWHLREEHKEAVLAGLEHIYGSTNDSLSFLKAVFMRLRQE